MTLQNNHIFPKLIKTCSEDKSKAMDFFGGFFLVGFSFFLPGSSYLFVVLFNILRIQGLVVTEGEKWHSGYIQYLIKAAVLKQTKSKKIRHTRISYSKPAISQQFNQQN